MNIIKQQFEEILQRGIIPCMEFERDYDGSVEWFAVDINVSDVYVEFSFDQDGFNTYFDGAIIGSDNFYKIPVDVDLFPSLHSYLEFISDNIVEGYLIPNNIMVGQ